MRGHRLHQSLATKSVAPSLMDESTNAEGFSDVDVRPNAGITRSPLDEIKAIQTLLADVYKDAGDGRTLFRELVQNADDALAQAAEIRGGPLPPTTRRLLIQVHEQDGTTTVDVTHWGRLINDTGGAAFPPGRERQWDQDLYFMMLMNLSGKPGEAPGDTSSSSTTGRFGLGFKSVHLISSSPSVVSGLTGWSAGSLAALGCSQIEVFEHDSEFRDTLTEEA